jgi:hypothetical protein
MKNRIPSSIAAAIIALVIASPVSADKALMSFEELIATSDLIFVGTLSEAHPFLTKESIVTRYRFTDVRPIKGQESPDSLILYQAGGSIGGTTVSSAEDVQFVTGERYVVFAYSGGSTEHAPGSAMWVRSARPDSGSSPPVFHWGRDATVVAFDERHLVLLLTSPWRPDLGPEPPPRLPLKELLRESDSRFEASLKQYSHKDAERLRRQLRSIYLYPHQDPGDRVSEDQFLAVFRRFVDRIPAK